MDGFSYCGIHCSKYNIGFIPDAKERWFKSPSFTLYEEDVSGRDGGYYYGNNVKIRKFTLQCYFEEITKEMREEIRNWLDRNTKGKLVFDERPFVYYNVRPTDVTSGEIYTILTKRGEVYSGTFTATFSAYEPYGYLTSKTQTDEAEMEGAGLVTGQLHSDEMPDDPVTTDSSFLLYNPGTQPCNTLLQIGGSGTNITLFNEANGTFCKLYALPESGYLEINSSLGKIVWVHGESRDTFFEYHNEGYLTLDPYLPRHFSADATYTTGSNEVTFQTFIPTEDLVGKFVLLGGTWNKITAVSEENASIEIENAMATSGSEITKIVTMNEITITGTLTNLNILSIDYFPLIV